MTHDNPTSPFDSRVAKLGLSCSEVTENVAWNAKNPVNAIKMWMNSPGHRRNILNPRSIYFGAAVSGSYWTTEFATPSDNDEALGARKSAVLCPLNNYINNPNNYSQNDAQNEDLNTDSNYDSNDDQPTQNFRPYPINQIPDNYMVKNYRNIAHIPIPPPRIRYRKYGHRKFFRY
ncbi:hypothetical protein AYI69_g4449 [Smittium culicis]|uniref:SCP domain-containing protein n=1 Tax=Smittium culicis TaxID=133412 RepID=A0A1R1YDK3_9FUNG|nr:hypothetical protein AYI69_g4449 [Smittium culicis]